MRDMDAATKQYMSHRDVVADAFNFYLYGGEQRILPERLRKMDATEVASLDGKTDIGKGSIQKIRDELILWEMMRDEDAVYVILGIENQTLLSTKEKRQDEFCRISVRLSKRRQTDAGDYLSCVFWRGVLGRSPKHPRNAQHKRRGDLVLRAGLQTKSDCAGHDKGRRI